MPVRVPSLPPTPCRRHLVLATVSLVLAGCVILPPTPEEEEARMRAVRAEQARQAVRPNVVCSAKQGNPFALRKKVLVLALPVRRPNEAADLPDLAGAWSNALQKRLHGTDRFLLRDGSHYVLDPAGDIRKQVTSLAQSFDAQIVVAGQITSLGVQAGRIPLGQLGSLPQPFGEKRTVETELEIFDGQSGARLQHLHHSGEVIGEVENRGGAPLRGDFLRTPLGEAMAKMLERQVEDIEDELACLPLLARIARTQADEVRIDVGFTSNLKPGDRLRVIQQQGFPGSEGGQIEKTFGNLLIKQVFPEAALGQFQGEQPPDWRYSVYVRAW